MAKKNATKVSFFESTFGKFLMNNKAAAIFVVMSLIVASLSDVFLTPGNLLNLTRQVAYSVTLSAGYTLLLSSGNFDLSIGCMVGLVGVGMGKLLALNVPIPLVMLAGIAFGAALGAFNAIIINMFALPPFIATLATMSVYKGATYIWTKMVPISNLPDEFVAIGQGYTFGIPNQVYIMLIMCLIMGFILYKTRFGRYSLAMGGNREAARLAGINVNRLSTCIYAIMGVYVAVAAIMLTARSASAQVTAGQNTEMDAIAAVVVGGTPMSGGSANIIGTIFGCLIVGVINNGLNLMGVDANWQLVAKGIMILFAMVLDVISSRIANKMSKRRMANKN